jgi:hypothetical protein
VPDETAVRSASVDPAAVVLQFEGGLEEQDLPASSWWNGVPDTCTWISSPAPSSMPSYDNMFVVVLAYSVKCSSIWYTYSFPDDDPRFLYSTILSNPSFCMMAAQDLAAGWNTLAGWRLPDWFESSIQQA